MNRFRTPLILLSALALGACATAPRGTAYQPVVDLKGRDSTQYVIDLNECQTLAQQRADEVQKNAIAGALAGAVLSAILMPRGYRNEGAAKLGAVGAMGGAAEGIQTQETIIKRCLVGRGYSVLN